MTVCPTVTGKAEICVLFCVPVSVSRIVVLIRSNQTIPLSISVFILAMILPPFVQVVYTASIVSVGMSIESVIGVLVKLSL